MGHQFQVLGQPLHGGQDSLNSSARCLYAWWWWCYSLMLLLQSYLLLLLLLIFSITFTFLALLEYYKQELYCHRKKTVYYFSDLLIELSGVVFNFCRIYWLLARTSGFAALFVVANCARENGNRSCSYGATIARRINVCAGGLAKLVFVTHVFVRVWGLETLA